jgi:predicted LPLAT superfamily acyltransferase
VWLSLELILAIGSWCPFFGKYGKKMNVVMMNLEFEGIRRVLELNKCLDAFNVITIEGDSLEYIFKIRDALARGEYVSLQGDRISRSEKHIQKTFMGKSASFPLGPFVIASRMNVPVVFFFAEHVGFKRYKFDFVLSSYNDVNQDKQREKFLVEEYVKVLEDRVKRYPEQWYNFYDFWDYER